VYVNIIGDKLSRDMLTMDDTTHRLTDPGSFNGVAGNDRTGNNSKPSPAGGVSNLITMTRFRASEGVGGQNPRL